MVVVFIERERAKDEEKIRPTGCHIWLTKGREAQRQESIMDFPLNVN